MVLVGIHHSNYPTARFKCPRTGRIITNYASKQKEMEAKGFVLAGSDEVIDISKKSTEQVAAEKVEMTKDEMKKRLDVLGVTYDPKAKKSDLLGLIEAAEALED